MTRDEKVQKAIRDAAAQNLLSQDEVTLINERKLALVDKEVYVKKALGAAVGIRNVIEASDDKTVGVTNLQNGRLPKGKVLVVTHIKVESNANASLTAAKYTPVIVDPALTNGEFDMQQNGRVLFEDMPLANFIPQEDPLTATDAYVELDRPFILTSEGDIILQTETPIACQANTNIAFYFKGLQFTRKG
jgi:hypothetical protein